MTKLIEYKAFLKHEENETAGMIAKFHISISSSMEINLKREKKKKKKERTTFKATTIKIISAMTK